MEPSNVQYEPSVLGRIARCVLPIMNRILPQKIFKVVYKFLYRNYRVSIRYYYLLLLCIAHFSKDPKEILKKQLVYNLLPYTMGGIKALENAFHIISLIEERKINGDIVECGVAEGGTAAMMTLSSIHLGDTPRKKWFFDSYEGLPEPTEEDFQNGKTGNFIRPLPKGSCLGTLSQVKDLFFNKLNLEPNEIFLIKGWFQETVPRYVDKIDKISVLRLDGDWYESTKIPLEYFYDKVATGGFIIIDDYLTCYGSKKAVDEFIDYNKLEVKFHPDLRGGIWFEKH